MAGAPPAGARQLAWALAAVALTGLVPLALQYRELVRRAAPAGDYLHHAVALALQDAVAYASQLVGVYVALVLLVAAVRLRRGNFGLLPLGCLALVVDRVRAPLARPELWAPVYRGLGAPFTVDDFAAAQERAGAALVAAGLGLVTAGVVVLARRAGLRSPWPLLAVPAVLLHAWAALAIPLASARDGFLLRDLLALAVAAAAAALGADLVRLARRSGRTSGAAGLRRLTAATVIRLLLLLPIVGAAAALRPAPGRDLDADLALLVVAGALVLRALVGFVQVSGILRAADAAPVPRPALGAAVLLTTAVLLCECAVAALLVSSYLAPYLEPDFRRTFDVHLAAAPGLVTALLVATAAAAAALAHALVAVARDLGAPPLADRAAALRRDVALVAAAALALRAVLGADPAAPAGRAALVALLLAAVWLGARLVRLLARVGATWRRPERPR
jgi:hypothetical protein